MFDRIVQWFKESWAAMEEASLYTVRWLDGDDHDL